MEEKRQRLKRNEKGALPSPFKRTQRRSKEIMTIFLRSHEGEIFDVNWKVFKMMTTLQDSVDFHGVVDLPKLSSCVIEIIIEWAYYHVDEQQPIDYDDSIQSTAARVFNAVLDPYDASLLENFDTETLLELSRACSTLRLNSLETAALKIVAIKYRQADRRTAEDMKAIATQVDTIKVDTLEADTHLLH